MASDQETLKGDASKALLDTSALGLRRKGKKELHRDSVSQVEDGLTVKGQGK